MSILSPSDLRHLSGLAYFSEVGKMLGWPSLCGVIMLWWMLDESYEHSKETGHAVKVTVGGAVASFEAWSALSLEWAATLERFEVPAFHMTDFEANAGLFKGWKKTPDRRRMLLSSLLDVIGAHVHRFWGVARTVENTEGRQSETYRQCVDDLIKELSRQEFSYHQIPSTLVFAWHKDFSPVRVREAIQREGSERFGLVKSYRPENMCPLQVADLVAYEVSRMQRPNAPERYPFTRLRDAAKAAGGSGSFSLSWR